MHKYARTKIEKLLRDPKKIKNICINLPEQTVRPMLHWTFCSIFTRICNGIWFLCFGDRDFLNHEEDRKHSEIFERRCVHWASTFQFFTGLNPINEKSSMWFRSKECQNGILPGQSNRNVGQWYVSLKPHPQCLLQVARPTMQFQKASTDQFQEPSVRFQECSARFFCIFPKGFCWFSFCLLLVFVVFPTF